MLLEKLGNKFDGFGFESNEAINNKIIVDLDNFASDIFKKDKNITKKDLKKKLDDILENSNYSTKKIFKDTFEDKRDKILDAQENYLKEEEKKKHDAELERLRR